MTVLSWDKQTPNLSLYMYTNQEHCDWDGDDCCPSAVEGGVLITMFLHRQYLLVTESQEVIGNDFYDF